VVALRRSLRREPALSSRGSRSSHLCGIQHPTSLRQCEQLHGRPSCLSARLARRFSPPCRADEPIAAQLFVEGMRSMTPEEMNHLRVAKDLIENPGLAAKLSHIVGAPIEKAFEMVPPKWRETVAKGVHEAIEAGLKAAVRTMNREPSRSPSNRLHKFLVGATG